MKSLQLSEDVLPLGDFKTHASRVLRQLKDSQRPVVITQNGRPAAVLITPEEFDRIQERETFLLAVHEGLADANAGRLVEDQEVQGILDEEFGLLEPSVEERLQRAYALLAEDAAGDDIESSFAIQAEALLGE